MWWFWCAKDVETPEISACFPSVLSFLVRFILDADFVVEVFAIVILVCLQTALWNLLWLCRPIPLPTIPIVPRLALLRLVVVIIVVVRLVRLWRTIIVARIAVSWIVALRRISVPWVVTLRRIAITWVVICW